MRVDDRLGAAVLRGGWIGDDLCHPLDLAGVEAQGRDPLGRARVHGLAVVCDAAGEVTGDVLLPGALPVGGAEGVQGAPAVGDEHPARGEGRSHLDEAVEGVAPADLPLPGVQGDELPAEGGPVRAVSDREVHLAGVDGRTGHEPLGGVGPAGGALGGVEGDETVAVGRDVELVVGGGDLVELPGDLLGVVGLPGVEVDPVDPSGAGHGVYLVVGPLCLVPGPAVRPQGPAFSAVAVDGGQHTVFLGVGQGHEGESLDHGRAVERATQVRLPLQFSVGGPESDHPAVLQQAEDDPVTGQHQGGRREVVAPALLSRPRDPSVTRGGEVTQDESGTGACRGQTGDGDQRAPSGQHRPPARGEQRGGGRAGGDLGTIDDEGDASAECGVALVRRRQTDGAQFPHEPLEDRVHVEDGARTRDAAVEEFQESTGEAGVRGSFGSLCLVGRAARAQQVAARDVARAAQRARVTEGVGAAREAAVEDHHPAPGPHPRQRVPDIGERKAAVRLVLRRRGQGQQKLGLVAADIDETVPGVVEDDRVAGPGRMIQLVDDGGGVGRVQQRDTVRRRQSPKAFREGITQGFHVVPDGRQVLELPGLVGGGAHQKHSGAVRVRQR